MTTANDSMITITNLSKYYGDVKAVNHLDLEIKRGEVFGLLGPNGAGKTTTTLMLLGLTDPTAGHATIDGLDCTRESLAVKNKVGYLPDNVGFYPAMSGLDNLIFSGMMNGLSKEDAVKRADAMLERVGMTYAADRKAGTYSRGMRQRLGIADVLMKDPRIIIMDEPTAGIDPSGIREITTLIRNLATEDGITIMISSHDLYQIQKISDRVGIFVKGRLIACGRIDELGKQLMSKGLFMFDVICEKNGEKVWDDEFQSLIRAIKGVTIIGKRVDGTVHIEATRDIQKDLLKTLVEADYTVREMHQEGGDLTEIYRKYFEAAEIEERGKNHGGKQNKETSGSNGAERFKAVADKLTAAFRENKQ
jgi:ABC-2 type transport system ATP-binding protein